MSTTTVVLPVMPDPFNPIGDLQELGSLLDCRPEYNEFRAGEAFKIRLTFGVYTYETPHAYPKKQDARKEAALHILRSVKLWKIPENIAYTEAGLFKFSVRIGDDPHVFTTEGHAKKEPARRALQKTIVDHYLSTTLPPTPTSPPTPFPTLQQQPQQQQPMVIDQPHTTQPASPTTTTTTTTATQPGKPGVIFVVNNNNDTNSNNNTDSFNNNNHSDSVNNNTDNNTYNNADNNNNNTNNSPTLKTREEKKFAAMVKAFQTNVGQIKRTLFGDDVHISNSFDLLMTYAFVHPTLCTTPEQTKAIAKACKVSDDELLRLRILGQSFYHYVVVQVLYTKQPALPASEIWTRQQMLLGDGAKSGVLKQLELTRLVMHRQPATTPSDKIAADVLDAVVGVLCAQLGKEQAVEVVSRFVNNYVNM